MKTSDLKRLLTVASPKIKSSDMLSTGSTLLNLACTGKPRSGLIKGHYYYFVGDSGSGKTWLCLTSFAEACINPKFDDYRLIFDNAEDGALMDWEKFFGSKVAERVESPSVDKEGKPVHSTTVEEFFYHLDDAKEVGRPCIYVLDSMDALSSADELDKVQEQKKQTRSGKAVSGDYGLSKPKRNSSGLRQAMHFLHTSGSILIIISQTRDRIGFGAMFEPRTRGGGKALTFYATLEMWTTQAGHIKKRVKEKDREQGIYSKIHIKKNRITGKDRTVTIPIYHSYGIDDVGSCVDYLIEEGHWKKSNGIVTAQEFDFKGRLEELIQLIQNNDQERELQNLTASIWNDIEQKTAINRKKRYE